VNVDRATTHRYPRSRAAWALAGQDVLLVVALVVLGLASADTKLSLPLFVAIPLVLGVGVATLHHPSRVDVDEDGIAFGRYGRVHRFAWREIERIRVRRFVVTDRVLVRISPASALRGRYWILDSIEGFRELLTAMDARAGAGASPHPRPEEPPAAPRSSPPRGPDRRSSDGLTPRAARNAREK
jgi:hypothetical protein